ncbi:putative Aspartyl protease family protein 2 [Cocos nucifera]|uniref:Putative Aspartyl protease family protein 2 n=1 Tax=Cocos nucifera TaxID=13894 RepID=A0A8K0IRY6_COCNU|nr:putative Aspartyl protease family protein 2 [Cocos nucifera]
MPILQNSKMDMFYYVELMGISIGGSRVPKVSAGNLRLDSVIEKGGVIVDSRTSVMRLVRLAYTALWDAFKAGVAELRAAPSGFSLFDTCYNIIGKMEVKVPTVVMHLGSGASMPLSTENYLISMDTKGTFYFAFVGTDSGNTQQ